MENAPGIWALGDCALVPNPLTKGFHPPTAQHALRQGRALAQNLVAEIVGTKKRPFRFSTWGQLAPIGRRTGVANILGMKFSGFIAWWLWRTIYLFKLPSPGEEGPGCAGLDSGPLLRQGLRLCHRVQDESPIIAERHTGDDC